MPFATQAAQSYDAVVRTRTGDMTSKEVAFRHFNNFVKKELIQSALDMLHANLPDATEVSVVDIGSGRGGDVGKWAFMQSPALSAKTQKLQRHEVTKAAHYLCYDISPESIKEAKERFATFEGLTCSASFTVADCYSESFGSTLTEAQLVGCVHVVSIQFAFHYACASRDSISTILRNVSMCLCKGGVFIGTTVDQKALSTAVRQGQNHAGLFSIELLDSNNPSWVESVDEYGTTTSLLPLGTAYNFCLEGFVDCPEYVVPMEEVKEIAALHGLQWVADHSQTFPEMLPSYTSNWKKNKGNQLSDDELALVSLYRCFCFVKQ